MQNLIQGVLGIILVIVVVLLIFMLLRQVALWYWGINERIELQRRNNVLLKQILDKLNETK